jgi:tRNA dimethylallyltransferase
MKTDKRKVILIVGPTAVGKTSTSVKIAKSIHSEIISADAMQIYKGMDIGTAKITEREKEGIPHHLIDIVNPDEMFTVSDFKSRALNLISQLHQKNKIPVIAGGTGLYVNALIYELDFSRSIRDSNIRQELSNYAKKHGSEALHHELTISDPASADKIHPNNVKRVIRALEVYRITGKTFSSLNQNFRKEADAFDYILIGLEMSRDLLYNRINHRVDDMLNQGLIEEVEQLLKSGYGEDLVSMKGIGYKEMIQHLKHEITYETAVQLIKRNTRRFAKRQFTWFKSDQRIHWVTVDPSNLDRTYSIIKNHLTERGVPDETNN